MSNTVDIDHLNVDLSKCDYIDIDFRQCRISSFATGWQNGDPVGCDFRIYANYDDFKNHNNILQDNFYYKSDATFKDTYYTYDVDISISDDPDTRNNDDYLKYYFPLGSYIVIQRGIIRSPINEQTTTIYKSDGYLVITAVPLSYESIGGEYVTFNGYLTINGILDEIEFKTVRVTDKDYNTVGYTLRVYKVNADGTPVTSNPDTSEGSGSSESEPSGGDDSGDSGDSGDSHSDVDNPPKDTNSNITITFTDTGTVGYSVDPNEILYAGGQEVIPKTFAQKDNTLFMGNYKEENALLKNEVLINNIKGSVRVSYSHGKYISKGQLGSLYMYNNQLKYSSYRITTLKGGEWYRFGLIFHDE